MSAEATVSGRSRVRKVAASTVRVTIATALTLALLVLAFGIAVRQPNFGRLPFPEGARADSELLRKHVEFLTTEAFPRSIGHPEQLDRAADYIAAAFSSSGARVAEQVYSAGPLKCRNIIARFGPASGRLFIVGAHYDAFGNLPGADDNASGTAGLLELSRLVGTRTLTSPLQLVAFSTEEPPFFGGPQMGSAVHAHSLQDDGVEVVGMISLEMIGFYSSSQPNHNLLLHLVYPRTGDFVCVAGRWADRAFARGIKKSFRGATDVPAYSYSGPVGIGVDLSDQRNYWARGYPAVMITDTAFLRNPNYHSSSDVAATLDYQRMAGVVDGLLSTAIHFTEDGRP